MKVALPRVFNVILWIVDCNPIELSCCQPIPHTIRQPRQAIGFHFNQDGETEAAYDEGIKKLHLKNIKEVF